LRQLNSGEMPSRVRAIRVAAAEGGSAALSREAPTRPLIVEVGRVRRGTPAHRISQPLRRKVKVRRWMIRVDAKEEMPGVRVE
jgi:hypothetical protein